MEKRTKSVIPDGIDINENLALENLRIDPTEDLSEPPVVCSIAGSPAMTAGNFSLLTGKAKSGKTFFLGSVIAGFVSNDTYLGVITGSLPEDKRTVLYFDTEQSAYHATRTVKRICNLVGNPSPVNLIAYGLRPLTPAERLEAIEDKISATYGLGAVAIDGVRDLLTIGINDEAEATSLTSKFLKWTAEYDIHLVLLLHQNKTDLNVRGHIGSELQNKAETTLSITKDIRTNSFVVSCEYSRDISFDDFAFRIEDETLVPSELPEEGQMRAKNPQRISDQDHFKVLNEVYKDNSRLSYRDLSDRIKYGFGNTFGDNNCRTFIYHYLHEDWIKKERVNRNVFYAYTRAVF